MMPIDILTCLIKPLIQLIRPTVLGPKMALIFRFMEMERARDRLMLDLRLYPIVRAQFLLVIAEGLH